ncbi:venom metalloproteinase antarease-like TtrivMP_A isoform X2 [Rhipicephalus sanguineus]|uniref:venom metalloproteinase antarease-like TtrivMP_A isoform X2 n=1 Tax=Rhipicephalus sanguineus TaxID=34632 RepID=UPI001895AAA4|nr:venom metalloproteinase antarease-like TtrivMP_A isoform X2 [Rhipicephalus sanguineus]
MARVLLQFLLCTTLTLITGARKQYSHHSFTVYPQVFEDREDESKKLLVLHEGHSLTLSKGSVLSESVLLRDLTESGVKETYIDGRQHEKDLYQDVETQASLLVQAQATGHYHIVGLINSTHLIEPIGNMERSSVAGIAHRITAIPEHKGIIGALKANRHLHVQAREIKQETPILPKNFTVEMMIYADYYHTMFLEEATENRLGYFIVLMLAVSLRMQQLTPPGSIAVTAIQSSWTPNETYVKLYSEDQLLGTETLKTMAKIANRSHHEQLADVVLLLTGRSIVQYRKSNNTTEIDTENAGLAYTGSACRYLKVGVAMDYPGYYMAVNIITHELSHSLNASHDGQKDAKNCSGEHEHLMNTHVGGKQNFLYSSCSKRSIRKFLMSQNGSCLRHKINEGYVFQVPYTYLQRKAPFLNGIDYCQRFFPDYSDVEYVEPKHPVNGCRFKCMFGDGDSKLREARLIVPNGTPCNGSIGGNVKKVCHNGFCVPKRTK